MPINERQIALRSGGNYETLKDYLDRVVCKRTPWNEAVNLTVSSAQRTLVPTTAIPGTNVLSVADSGLFETETTEGIVAASGALGTNLTTLVTDTIGNVLNLAELRDPTSHESITYEERRVYGLLHSDAVDGSEHDNTNLQMTFAYIAADGTVTPVTLNQSVEFRFARAYLARTQGAVTLLDGATDREVVEADLSGYVQTEDAAVSVVDEKGWSQASAVGTSTDYARADHTHGTQDLPVAEEIAFDSDSTGTSLTSNNVQDAIEELEGTIDDIEIPEAGTTVVDEDTYGQTSAVGISTNYAREDHTHGTPPTPVTKVLEITNGEGDITGELRIIAGTDISLVQVGNDVTISSTTDLSGYVKYDDAAISVEEEKGWSQESAVGTSTDYARADHTHGTQDLPDASDISFDNTVTGSNLTSVNVQDAIVELEGQIEGVDIPDAATTVQTEKDYNQDEAVGTSANYAREDHTHGTPPTPVTKINEVSTGEGDITGAVTLTAGNHITLEQVGSEITIAATASQLEVLEDLYAHSGGAIPRNTNISVATIWTNETPVIPADYVTNPYWEFYLNGVRLRKGLISADAEIERVDSGTIRISTTIDSKDVLEYKFTQVTN